MNEKKSLDKISLMVPWILMVCFIGYSVLSWVLLFRDKRALEGIALFYPELNDWLFFTRDFLLQNNLNTIPTLLFGIISVISIYFYLRSFLIKISLRKTIIFAAIFQVITFLSYPVLSTDIFSYMFSERVATVHNENVWKVIPATFPQDPFFKISDWKETTSVYGAVHFFSYVIPSYIGQNNLLVLTVMYKLVAAAFAIGSGVVLYKLLKVYKPHYVEKGMRLVFWSPLFILEIFGSAHNDSIMIFFTLLSFFFFTKKQWVFAGIAIALAVQVKILPIVLVFFFALYLFKKKAIRAVSLLIVGFLAVNALAFIFMQVSPVDFLQRVLYNGGVYWQSLSNLLRYYVEGSTIILLIAFLLWVLFFILQLWKHKIEPIYGYAVVLLTYLLFVSSAYWNWYVLWMLPLIPFIDNKKLIWTTLIFSFTSLFAYPLLWLSLRFGFGSSLWPIITYVFIFGVPIMTYLYLKFNEKESNTLIKNLALEEVFAEKTQH